MPKYLHSKAFAQRNMNAATKAHFNERWDIFMAEGNEGVARWKAKRREASRVEAKNDIKVAVWLGIGALVLTVILLGMG